MTLDPRRLDSEPALLEEIEKATLRMVTQAIYDFRDEAREFFVYEPDAVADIGEDITREAMDRMGTSVLPVRLFGRIDYKRARYVFHPEYSVRQALFIDSKAEQVAGSRTVTIQTSQTSLRIRQIRSGQPIDVQGTLPRTLQLQGVDYLVTTVFVKVQLRKLGGQLRQGAPEYFCDMPSQRDVAGTVQPLARGDDMARGPKRSQSWRIVSSQNQPTSAEASGQLAYADYRTGPRSQICLGRMIDDFLSRHNPPHAISPGTSQRRSHHQRPRQPPML